MPTPVIELEVLEPYAFPLANNAAWNQEYPTVRTHEVRVNVDPTQEYGGIIMRNVGPTGYGAKNSNKRKDWEAALESANQIIEEVQIAWDDLSPYPEVQAGIYPLLTKLVLEEGRYSFERSILPSGFVNLETQAEIADFVHTIAGLGASWNLQSNPSFRGGSMGTLASLTTLYTTLYQSPGPETILLPYEIGDHSEPRKQGLDLKILNDLIIPAIQEELTQRKVLTARALLFEEGSDVFGAGFTNYTLQDRDITFLSSRKAYQEYFSTTFNKDVITMVPLLQNFYLTGKYFSDIETAFETTKDRALDILLTTIRNNDDFRKLPDLSRPAAEAAIAAGNGGPAAINNSAARDFILKMIVQTPINILKGLVELIDPHISISKLIKTGTGFAFNELASQMDVPAQQINEELSGEDLLKLVLCIIDEAQQAGDEGLSNATGAPDADFFPRISIDGVDFTGTVSGMLMIPPSPLGLLYLLLELLKNEATDAITNVDGAATTAAEGTECADQQEE